MKFTIIIWVAFLVSASNVRAEKAVRFAGPEAAVIIPGAERMDLYLPFLKGKSVAVFANQTSVIGSTHLVDALLAKGIHIQKIFAPEHGFRGEADAGEELGNMSDAKTGIRIVSLYGDKTKPSTEDLKDVDVMVFDIQDVGVRFYTYISSLQKYMEAAIENKKTIMVLDRPNPNGFYVDGPVLESSFKSFVGMQQIPVVYGMTIAEYAAMLLGEAMLSVPVDAHHVFIVGKDAVPKIPGTGFNLFLVPNKNYTHKSRYTLPVKPSPNLPNMQSVYLYPSICFFEGTRISLGRGTDKPFQQFGSPSFPKNEYTFTPRPMAGAKNPPLLDQTCYGYDLSKIDCEKEIAGRLNLTWLMKAYQLYPRKEDFFLVSGYFNKLAGNSLLMQQIREGKKETEIRKSWDPGLRAFKKTRKKYLLYPDFQ
jgi:uncharacterized protein YbbC (DUF1343 family)